MARGHVEVFNLSDAPRRADAILERGRFFFENGNYVWTFVGSREEGVLGAMTTSNGMDICAFRARCYSDVIDLVKNDRGKPAGKPGEVVIGEAHLVPNDDLERAIRDLTEMGINVRLYRE